jgi:hypothetical protein
MNIKSTEDELDLATEEFKKHSRPLRKQPKNSWPLWKA